MGTEIGNWNWEGGVAQWEAQRLKPVKIAGDITGAISLREPLRLAACIFHHVI